MPPYCNGLYPQAAFIWVLYHSNRTKLIQTGRKQKRSHILGKKSIHLPFSFYDPGPCLVVSYSLTHLSSSKVIVHTWFCALWLLSPSRNPICITDSLLILKQMLCTRDRQESEEKLRDFVLESPFMTDLSAFSTFSPLTMKNILFLT